MFFCLKFKYKRFVKNILFVLSYFNCNRKINKLVKQISCKYLEHLFIRPYVCRSEIYMIIMQIWCGNRSD